MVRHETLVRTIGKEIGPKREVDVGEASFGGLFLPPTCAITYSPWPASTSPPPPARALDAAVRILAAVPRAPPSLEFRGRTDDGKLDDPPPRGHS